MSIKRLFTIIALVTLLFAKTASAGVTVQQAVRGGCYSAAQLKAICTEGVALIPSGSITERKFDSLSYTSGKVTKLLVTSPDTWVYRGYDTGAAPNWHVSKLLQGILYSKAANRVDGLSTPQERAQFWQMNGPELASSDLVPAPPISLIMRLLAISSSDAPPSQFVSVALKFDVASRFGNVVYAFQVTPNSPILGMRDCELGTGEDQLQIFGAAKIANLHRRRSGGGWEKYDGSGGWGPVSGDPGVKSYVKAD